MGGLVGGLVIEPADWENVPAADSYVAVITR